MKEIEQTVIEMINQLQDLKQQLNHLNTDETLEKDNLENILLQARQSPFNEHPLVQQDTHTQNIYLTMLISTLQYDYECFEERALYIAKIYVALNSKQSFETYFAQAKTMKLETLQEFFITMQQQNFKKLFILEALILLGVHQTKDLAAYIVELASSLQLTEQEFSLLCKMAKSIVSNNKTSIDELIGENMDERHLCPHLFIQVGSSFTPLYYSGKHTDIFTQKDIKNRTAIYLEGVTLQSEDELVFENLTELRIIDCRFKQKAIKIIVRNCKKVFIDGMNFSQHQGLHWIKFQGGEEIKLKKININSSKLMENNFISFYNILKLEINGLKVSDVSKIKQYNSTGGSSTIKILSCSKVKQSRLIQAKFRNIYEVGGFYGVSTKKHDSSINKLQENIDCIFE